MLGSRGSALPAPERLPAPGIYGDLQGPSTVAKMASHAIFQYNVLVINDAHNTWTNMIVKMIVLRLLGSSDDKEKIGVTTGVEGEPPLAGLRAAP